MRKLPASPSLRLSRLLLVSCLLLGAILPLLDLDVHPVVAAEDSPTGYLHTEGAKIVDSLGHEVRLTGVNWFGMETGTYAPHGLWSRNWEEMLDQVVAMGFNTIRLPFSTQMLDPDAQRTEGVDYKINPDLKGLNGLQVMDRIVEGARQRNLKVILDRHRPGVDGQSSLWYTDHYSEQRWIDDWVMLAKHYAGNDTVIGVDLHNEPHGEATWGTGDPKTDWRLAAERAGNAILAINPHLLIIVEGVERFGNDSYWWGGNLKGALEYPVRLKVPSQLVYSAHDYGPGVFQQNWFSAPDFPANMPAIWRAHWGYLVEQDIAPVLLGEFGGRSVGSDAEGTWQQALLAYLKDHGISYTYWALNPNSGDTGGILNDDWTTVNQAKLKLLQGYQWPLIKPLPTPTATNVPLPTSTPTTADGRSAADVPPPVAATRPAEPSPPEPEPAGLWGQVSSALGRLLGQLFGNHR